MNAQKVYAVIISYNGGPELVKTVRSVRPQVGKVIVVDNGSVVLTKKILGELEFSGEISLISLAENQGIAHAQNIGIEQASKENAQWVLTLDQDSTCSPDMVANLLDAAEVLNKDSLGFCCPAINWMAGHHDIPHTSTIDEVQYAISSGCLFPMTTLRKMGPQREDYFIDSVDFEYCLRLMRSGYRLFRVKGAILGHKLGARREIRIFGFNFSISVHSPFRRYYVARNHIFLARDYWRDFPVFIAKKTIFLLILIAQIVLLENRKLDNLWNLWRGLMDGFGGRGGKNVHAPRV
ncbi:glycosyltransferase family 2 protein [Ralstonia sp. L16]|uniref:glycosyltransferase family 2 protein n=1 Tax=Ralstonia sp. L16 TaxID=3423950 RepID=UPI003F7AEBAA